MKVTDAMVAKLAECLGEVECEVPWRDAEPILRSVLEVVLADVDVSSPSVVNALAEVVADREARIKFLEHVLGRVRAELLLGGSTTDALDALGELEDKP